MKRLWITGSLLAGMALLQGCSKIYSPPPPPPITEQPPAALVKHWTLAETLGHTRDDFEKTRARMEIKANGDVIINVGCNDLHTTMQVNHAARLVKFGEVTSTRMACPDNKLEPRIIELLPLLKDYGIAGGQTLVFRGPKSESVRFIAGQWPEPTTAPSMN